MVVLESLHKMLDSSRVLGNMTLVHLIDVLIIGQLGRIDREWDQQFDLMLLDESRQGSHLLRVERTDNQVALGSSLIIQNLVDIAVLSSIPGMDVNRNATLLQAVASHQHTTVVLYHALAVAIHIVQRQHHTQSDGTLTYIIGSIHIGLFGYGGCYLQGSKRNLQHVAFLQFVARLAHLGVSLHQLFDGEIIHTRNAEDGFLLLHLMQSAYLFTLLSRGHTNCQTEGS